MKRYSNELWLCDLHGYGMDETEHEEDEKQSMKKMRNRVRRRGNRTNVHTGDAQAGNSFVQRTEHMPTEESGFSFRVYKSQIFLPYRYVMGCLY